MKYFTYIKYTWFALLFVPYRSAIPISGAGSCAETSKGGECTDQRKPLLKYLSLFHYTLFKKPLSRTCFSNYHTHFFSVSSTTVLRGCRGPGKRCCHFSKQGFPGHTFALSLIIAVFFVFCLLLSIFSQYRLKILKSIPLLDEFTKL